MKLIILFYFYLISSKFSLRKSSQLHLQSTHLDKQSIHPDKQSIHPDKQSIHPDKQSIHPDKQSTYPLSNKPHPTINSKLHQTNKQKEKIERMKKIQKWQQQMRFKTNKISVENQGGEKTYQLRNWMKFLEENKNGPKSMSFFVNNNFFEQKVNEEKDECGSKMIPSAFSFFFVLTRQYILILSSRDKNQITQAVQSIAINRIMKKGGVIDEGNFKEGFCFKVNVVLDSKKTYVICAEELAIKQQWMQSLKENRNMVDLMNQSKQNQEPMEEGIAQVNGMNEPSSQCDQSSDQEQQQQEGAVAGGQQQGTAAGGQQQGGGQKIDGKWIVMQDWSSCTKACGGGTQTLHRVCDPPKNGGAECQGDPLLTRLCNEQNCEIEDSNGDGGGNGGSGQKVGPEGEKVKTNEPMVALQRVSPRMQIYERCLIKDTDVDVVQEDMEQFQIKPKLPGRMVMNNRTLTVFMRNNINSAVFSIELDRIQVMEHKQFDECWRIIDNTNFNHKISVCGLSSANEPHEIIKQEWIKDINFFKNHCYQPILRGKSKADGSGSDSGGGGGKDDDPLLKMKEEELEVEKQEEQAENAQKANVVIDPDDVKQQFKGLQQMAIEAITKEMKYEALLEQEEKQKMKDEKNALKMKLESLKNKEECMGNAAEKQMIQDEQEQKKISISEQINELRDQIKCMIVKKRQAKQKQLEKLRKLNEMSKKDLLTQIQETRAKLTNDVMGSHKEGDAAKCQTKDQAIQCSYCEAHFKEDASALVDCKGDDYCMICCITEFGSYHLAKRNKCIESCDNQDGKGNWVWVPSNNQVK